MSFQKGEKEGASIFTAGAFTGTAAEPKVAPATAAQITSWTSAWPNVLPHLKDVDSAAKFFNLAAKKEKEITGHKKPVLCLGWNSGGSRLASGSHDTTAKLWNIDHKGLHGADLELKGHHERVSQLCWNPNHSDQLVTASYDKSVRLWDARNGKSTATIATKVANINVVWSPDSTLIAVGDDKDVVSVIDCKTNKVVSEHHFKHEVNEIAWGGKSSEQLLVTLGNGNVDIVKYPNFETLHSITAHTGPCFCIEVDPDGKYLATGGGDALVSIWNTSNLVCVRTIDRIEAPTRNLSFSAHAALLAAASEDTTIEIVAVESGESVHSLKTRTASNAVAWHPRYLLLAYALDEKSAPSFMVLGYPS